MGFAVFTVENLCGWRISFYLQGMSQLIKIALRSTEQVSSAVTA
jgi:hypothetical protein